MGSTGNQRLDAEHRRIIEKASALINGGHGADIQNIAGLFSEVRDELLSHFSSEELEMIDCEYYHYPLHKQDHDKIVACVDGMVDRVANGSVEEVGDIVGRMPAALDLIILHFNLFDQIYADFLVNGPAAAKPEFEVC